MSLPDGAADQTHAFGNIQFCKNFAEPVPFLPVVDPGRKPDMVGIRKKYQIPAGNCDIGRNARTLGPDRPFGDLHKKFGVFGKHFRNVGNRDLPAVQFGFKLLQALRLVGFPDQSADPVRHLGEHGAFLPAFGGKCAVGLHVTDVVQHVVGGGKHILVMEKRVFRRTDIHEGGLQFLLQMGDASQIDGAGEEFILVPTFDFVFFQSAVSQQRKAGLQLLAVENNLFFVFHESDFFS